MNRLTEKWKNRVKNKLISKKMTFKHLIDLIIRNLLNLITQVHKAT